MYINNPTSRNSRNLSEKALTNNLRLSPGPIVHGMTNRFSAPIGNNGQRLRASMTLGPK